MRTIIKKVESNKELIDAKKVRKAVFVEEQQIDFDIENSGDDESDHFLAYQNDTPVGAGRIRYPEKDIAKIERMAVLKEMRGKNIGGQILETMLEYLEKEKVPKVILEAQLSAKGFYEKYGFEQEGDIFEEVGLPHVKMSKLLTPKDETKKCFI